MKGIFGYDDGYVMILYFLEMLYDFVSLSKERCEDVLSASSIALSPIEGCKDHVGGAMNFHFAFNETKDCHTLNLQSPCEIKSRFFGRANKSRVGE